MHNTIKNNKDNNLLPLSSDDLLYIEEESDEEDASQLAAINDSFLGELSVASALNCKDIKSHISVPSNEDIQTVLLKQKRQQLLDKLSA